MGGPLIGGASLAPAFGLPLDQTLIMGACLTGMAAMGGRAYGLYRSCIDTAEEVQGFSQSLRKACTANQRTANWIRRLNESTHFYWETDGLGLFRCPKGTGAKEAGIFQSMDIGVSLYDWPATNMDKTGWDALRKQGRAEEAFWNLELQLRDEQGRDAWIALSGRPTYGPGRAFNGYCGIGRDITPQKIAERLVC